MELQILTRQRSLEGKNLTVKEYNDLGLYLVKYDKTKCDMSDP